MIFLDDPELGTVELHGDPYTVTSFQIGSPAVRAAARNRALANGTRDTTRYTGARAATVSVTLNDQFCGNGAVAMQTLFDRLMPYTVPRRRPTMRWSLPGDDTKQRQMVVRGDTAPIVIQSRRHPVLAIGFVAPEGEITSAGDPVCTLVDPALDVELGRAYDLLFNRTYPASSAIGDRLLVVDGNEQAHWTATMFGDLQNPFVLINGVRIDWASNGGLAIGPGQSLQVDTRDKTMYVNGDPLSPRFDRANFTEWNWSDILLRPGRNTIRFGAGVLGTGATMQFCYRPTWAG